MIHGHSPINLQKTYLTFFEKVVFDDEKSKNIKLLLPNSRIFWLKQVRAARGCLDVRRGALHMRLFAIVSEDSFSTKVFSTKHSEREGTALAGILKEGDPPLSTEVGYRHSTVFCFVFFSVDNSESSFRTLFYKQGAQGLVDAGTAIGESSEVLIFENLPTNCVLVCLLVLREFTTTCPVCEKVFHSKKYAKKHFLRFHADQERSRETCRVCNKSMLSMNMKAHMKRHDEQTQSQRFKCNDCGRSYKNKGDLTVHVKTHGQPNPVCSICGKVLRTKKLLKRHVATIHPTKPRCHECNKEFASEDEKREHKRVAHGLKFECTQCGEQLQSERSLKLHVKRVHTKSGAYTCDRDGCDKRFLYQSLLDMHVKTTHTKELSVKCEKCGTQFSNKYKLQRHEKNTDCTRTRLIKDAAGRKVIYY